MNSITVDSLTSVISYHINHIKLLKFVQHKSGIIYLWAIYKTKEIHFNKKGHSKDNCPKFKKELHNGH